MPKVHFPQTGQWFEVPEGTTILEVAVDNGIDLEHNCGGNCACSTCHVIIKEGFQTLPPVTEEEQDMLNEAEGLTEFSRLACQCQIKSNLTIEIPASSNPLNNPDVAEIEKLLKEKEQKMAAAGLLKTNGKK